MKLEEVDGKLVMPRSTKHHSELGRKPNKQIHVYKEVSVCAFAHDMKKHVNRLSNCKTAVNS